MKIFLRIIVLAIVLFVVALFYSRGAPPYVTPVEPTIDIETSTGTIHAIIADTESTREQGLSGRSGLSKDYGMIFIFPQASTYGFWMKDMRFALDIVWINADKQVVDVESQVLPETFPNIFYPTEPVKYVLELTAGEAQKFGIEKGAQLEFK